MNIELKNKMAEIQELLVEINTMLKEVAEKTGAEGNVVGDTVLVNTILMALMMFPQVRPPSVTPTGQSSGEYFTMPLVPEAPNVVPNCQFCFHGENITLQCILHEGHPGAHLISVPKEDNGDYERTQLKP